MTGRVARAVEPEAPELAAVHVERRRHVAARQHACFVRAARDRDERAPPLGDCRRRRAERKAANAPAVRPPQRPHSIDASFPEADGSALGVELLVVEVPRLPRAVATAAVVGAPDLLDLRLRHAQTDPAEAAARDEHAVRRQGEGERDGEQRHSPKIENRGVEVFNLFAEHEWDSEQQRDGYRHRVAAIGPRLGGALLGGSLYELPPGESSWPYHYEHGAEEWLLVVAGRPRCGRRTARASSAR